MIILTKHYAQRYRQRIAKTKRMQLFTERAFHYGKTLDKVRSKSFAKLLTKSEQKHGSSAKIYANCVYWFQNNIAITVYPIPQKLHRQGTKRLS